MEKFEGQAVDETYQQRLSQSQKALFGKSFEPVDNMSFVESLPNEKQSLDNKTMPSQVAPQYELPNRHSGQVKRGWLWADKFVISLHSTWKAYFDTFMDCVLVFNVLTTMYFLAFEPPTGLMFYIDAFSRLLFVVDLVLTFFVEIKDDRDNTIRIIRVIALNYLKTWLLLDTLAVLPLSLFGQSEAEYLCRMVRLLKLPAIVNVLDGRGISVLISRISNGKPTDSTVSFTIGQRFFGTILQLVLTMVIFVYILACVWLWFQKKVADYEYSDELSFEEAFGLTEGSNRVQLISSCYFMLTTLTTVGYGDLRPTNTYEEAFILFVLLLGVALFAYIMGSFNGVIQEFDQNVSTEKYLTGLNAWIGSLERLHGKLPKDLKSRICGHFVHYYANDRNKGLEKGYWRCDSADDLVSYDQEYLKDLPKDLVHHIYDHLYGEVFHWFSYFFGDTDLKYKLVMHFQPRSFDEGEVILKQGERAYEMVFVLDGEISCGPEFDGKIESVLSFRGGRTIIGDYCALTSCHSPVSFVALGKVTGFALHRKPFIDILNTFYQSERSRMIEMTAARNNHIKSLAQTKLDSLGIQTIDDTRSQAWKTKVVQCAKTSKQEATLSGIEEMLAGIGSVLDEESHQRSSLASSLKALI